MLAVDLREVSAKVRSGPQIDDEPDYTLSVWASVVPAHLTLGRPFPTLDWPKEQTFRLSPLGCPLTP